MINNWSITWKAFSICLLLRSIAGISLSLRAKTCLSPRLRRDSGRVPMKTSVVRVRGAVTPSDSDAGMEYMCL